jgi:integrase
MMDMSIGEELLAERRRRRRAGDRRLTEADSAFLGRLRHNFATEALRPGMGPMQLADVLGHSSLQMIERNYGHLNARDSYEAVVRMLAADGRPGVR